MGTTYVDAADRAPVVRIVDDDDDLRESLAWLLSSAGLDVATYATAEDFLAEFDDQRPNCLLLDLRMPGMGGLELQTLLGRQQCIVPIIFITGHGDVSTAVHAIRHGAFDFVLKPFRDETVVPNLVHRAIEHSRAMLRCRSDIQSVRERVDRLNEGERQVWTLVVEGKQNKVIADLLSISIKTVEARRKRALAKLGTRSPLEWAEMAAVVGMRGDRRQGDGAFASWRGGRRAP